jgi:hypothetical protein
VPDITFDFKFWIIAVRPILTVSINSTSVHLSSLLKSLSFKVADKSKNFQVQQLVGGGECLVLDLIPPNLGNC